MKLPLIQNSKVKINNSNILQKGKYKIVGGAQQESSNEFIRKVNSVQEVKVFLNKNFNSKDVDEAFIKDIETEYAEQYLLKIEMMPTKQLIKKLLNIKPLEKCDFFMTSETAQINSLEKVNKVVHIYPTAVESNMLKGKVNKSEDKQKYFLPKNIQSCIRIKENEEDRKEKEIIANIKKNKNDIDNLIYNKEKIDEMLANNKEKITELKLFSTQSPIEVKLTPDIIREKYIISKKIEPYDPNSKVLNNRGKFYNISKSISQQKTLITDPKYVFDITKMEKLDNNIIKEISEPIDVEFVIIMKDMNYILDNFPIEEFINVNKEQIKKSNELGKEISYKINLEHDNDILKIFKIFHSMDFYRLLALLINLIYWVAFGNNNDIQVDKSTKEYLYLKLLSLKEKIESKIIDKKLLTKVFIPLEIIFARIEVDNCFSRKFVNLYKNPTNKSNIMIKINNIITEIFDKNGYMNSFEILCGKNKELNKKMGKKILPNFKNKVYATGNYVEQIFSSERYNNINDNPEEVKEREKFILGQKVEFFNEYLQNVNRKLKKRNLEPIFTVSNIRKKEKSREELVQRRDMNLSMGNEYYNNYGFDKNDKDANVVKYIDNTISRLKTYSKEGTKQSDEINQLVLNTMA